MNDYITLAKVNDLNLQDNVVTSVYLDNLDLLNKLSNYLDKRNGGNISGDVSISTLTKTRWLDIERNSLNSNNKYTTDAYIACGSDISVGFKYFPIAYITADTENSILNVNCGNDELKTKMLNEVIGLKYSMDSQHGGVNVGKVLNATSNGDSNIVQLSVDNIRMSGSPIGMYFVEKPDLGILSLTYSSDIGGLAVGYGCKVHCYASVAEGNSTKAVGRYSHAEGYQNIADWGCHVEGRYNEALGIANHVEGYSNQIDNRTVAPQTVHIEGIYNMAVGNIDSVHVGGTCAKGQDSYSYTWNGNIGDVIDSNGNLSSGHNARHKADVFTAVSPYISHGEGTFNINPVGQENGLWIGEKTLANIINQYMQPIFDAIDPTYVGDIYDTLHGRKYVPATQLNEVFTYSENQEDLTKIIKLNSNYTSFGNAALSGCKNLTDIEIPEGISSLGTGAIRDCKKLSSITLPNSLVSISDNCFRTDSAISNITLPDSLTSVGSYGVGYLAGITTLSVPNSVTKLAAGAFGGNSNLTSINYSTGITATKSLTANVFINDYSLKEISAYQFNCSQLSTYVQKWLGATSKEMSQVSVFGSDGTMIFDKTASSAGNVYSFEYILS